MCLAYGLEKVTIYNTAFMLLQILHLLKRTFHFISKRSFQSHFKWSFQNFIFQIYLWQNVEVGGGGSGNTKRLDLIKMLISKFLCIHHINQTAFIFKKSNSSILNMPLLLPPKKREGEKKKRKHPWHKPKKSHVMWKATTLPSKHFKTIFCFGLFCESLSQFTVSGRKICWPQMSLLGIRIHLGWLLGGGQSKWDLGS